MASTLEERWDDATVGGDQVVAMASIAVTLLLLGQYDRAASPCARVADRRDAGARLLERAARIADPGRREGFLDKVPENARTLALARAWLDQGEAGPAGQAAGAS